MSDDARYTDLDLLSRTQQYLRSLLQGRASESVLAQAWDEFYRIYNSVMRRFAAAQGVRGAEIDDCLQEVWMEVVVRLDGFDHPRNRPGLRAWLYTIVRSKAADCFRRRARQSASHLERSSEVPSEAPSPPDQFEQDWERALLETLIEDLRSQTSARNAQLLKMRLLDGRSVQDVARALDLTPAQVSYRQYRLLRKLKVRAGLYTGKPFGPADSDTA